MIGFILLPHFADGEIKTEVKDLPSFPEESSPVIFQFAILATDCINLDLQTAREPCRGSDPSLELLKDAGSVSV